MKKIIIAVVILAILGGGVYMLTKDDKKPAAATTNQTSTTNPGTATTADVNNEVVTTKTSPSSSRYLADSKGMTLYTYDSDTTGVSKCTGSCLVSWPAYTDPGTITSLPTDITSITRTDNGKKQFAYKGMPLYYFTTDVTAGQITGENVEGFSLARP